MKIFRQEVHILCDTAVLKYRLGQNGLRRNYLAPAVVFTDGRTLLAF